MEVVFAIEVVIEDYLKIPIEKMIVVETLVVVLINFDADFQFDYGETVNVLEGMGAHYYAPKKIDLDLKSRPNSPAKSPLRNN